MLDGGLSTELEHRGYDLSSSLWSARLLLDDPGAVLAVHRAFLQAGAQVLTTASYQASLEGFARAGLAPAQARSLFARSVELAREAFEATGRSGWVAGSAGPYGAMLADGSEYTGDYGPSVGLPELRAFHRTQFAQLRDAGADVLACETIPSLAETQAVVEELERLEHPGWLSLTTVTGPDGVVRTRVGEAAADAFALAAGADQVIAVGVNCTAPDGVSAAVRVAASVSGKPVVVYPNSGEAWNAAAHTWTGPARSRTFTAGPLQEWLDGGTRLIGGCCRVGPDQIAELAALLR